MSGLPPQDDLLKKTRALIINYRANPNNVGVVRLNLNTGSRDIVMLQETLSYLNESLVRAARIRVVPWRLCADTHVHACNREAWSSRTHPPTTSTVPSCTST